MTDVGAPLLLTPEELRAWFRGFRVALHGEPPNRAMWDMVCAAIEGMLLSPYPRSSYVPKGAGVLDLPALPREPQPVHRPDGTVAAGELPAIEWPTE